MKNRHYQHSKQFQAGLERTRQRTTPKIVGIDAKEDLSVADGEGGRWKVCVRDDTGVMSLITRKEALYRAQALNDGILKDKVIGNAYDFRADELKRMFMTAANAARVAETGTPYNSKSVRQFFGGDTDVSYLKLS